MRNRVLAAWNALRGRPTVAFCHLHGGLTLASESQDALVVGNHMSHIK